MRCIAIENKNKCFKVINKEIYEFSRSKESYIELDNVDSLDVRMSFMVILNDLKDQIIVRSELNVWQIIIEKGDLKILVKQPPTNYINSENLITVIILILY